MKLTSFVEWLQTDNQTTPGTHIIHPPLTPEKLEKWQSKHKTSKLSQELLDFYSAHDGLQCDCKTDIIPALVFLPLHDTQTIRTLCNELYGPGGVPDAEDFPKVGLVLTKDNNGDLFLIYDSKKNCYHCLDHEGPSYIVGYSLEEALEWAANLITWTDRKPYLDEILQKYAPAIPPAENKPVIVVPDEDLGEGVRLPDLEGGSTQLDKVSLLVLQNHLASLERRRTSSSNHEYFDRWIALVKRFILYRAGTVPILPPGSQDCGVLAQIKFTTPDDGHYSAVCFTPDGKQFCVYRNISRSDGGLLSFHDLPSGSLVRQIPLAYHDYPKMVIDPNSQYLILSTSLSTPSMGMHFTRYNLSNGEVLGTYPITGQVFNMSHSPVTPRVAIIERNNGQNPCQLFDVASGQSISNFTAHKYPFAIRYSPDGSRIVTNEEDNKKVRLFDSDGHLITTLRTGGLYDFEFLPQNRLLVTGVDEKTQQFTCLLFDTTTGKRLGNLQLEDYATAGVTATGQLIMVNHDNGHVHLINTDTCALTFETVVHPKAFPKTISPYGNYALSTQTVDGLYLWQLK